MNPVIASSVDEFVRRVRAAEDGRGLVKAVVFGSVAKGTEHPGSDVDVLVVSIDPESIRDTVADAAFAVQMDRGVPVEPVVVALDEAFPPSSYFVEQALRTGEEVFSMEHDELREQAIAGIRELADEYLDSAQDALAGGRLRLALDGAYNAAELFLKSLILRHRDDLPGSHGGIVGAFGELYVKTGEVDRTLGREVNKALELRNAARYKPTARITEADVQQVIALARTVGAIRGA